MHYRITSKGFKHIAPTIACMHIAFPLCMSLMFSRILIEKFSVSKNIDCTDLMASDRFFDSIIQKCVMTLRYSDSGCWWTVFGRHVLHLYLPASREFLCKGSIITSFWVHIVLIALCCLMSRKMILNICCDICLVWTCPGDVHGWSLW